MQDQTDPENVRPQLSPRLAQVALCLRRGMTYQETADHLHVEYETARSHARRLREAVGIRRKALLTLWAERNHEWLQDLADPEQLG